MARASIAYGRYKLTARLVEWMFRKGSPNLNKKQFDANSDHKDLASQGPVTMEQLQLFFKWTHFAQVACFNQIRKVDKLNEKDLTDAALAWFAHLLALCTQYLMDAQRQGRTPDNDDQVEWVYEMSVVRKDTLRLLTKFAVMCDKDFV